MSEGGNGKVAEPGDGKLRGTLARAMLYMAQVYGANVKLPFESVWQWHQDNPPEPWEVRRAELIAERTGLRNKWILGRE
jgi:endonuclease I